MAETTETPTTQTEGATSSEAAATSLLTSTEAPATTEQPGEKPAAEAAKPAEGEKPAEEAAKSEGAPEKYVFTAPEGKEYDSAVLDSFSNAAKTANLTQDAAQKLLESMAPTLATRQQEQVDVIRAGWLEATKTDKEFGGDGLKENLAIAKKAVETYSTPELRKLLDDTGLGNHAEVIRLFFKVGKTLKEDSFVPGSPAGGSPDWGKIMYDKTPPA